MKVPITRKALVDWAGIRVVEDAESMVARGMVLEATYDHPHIAGAVLWNNRPLKTSLKILPDGMVESLCPCRANQEHGIICSHVVALGAMLVKRATDPLREAKYREEVRRATRMAAIDESEYILRVPPETPNAIQARLHITLGENWMDGFRRTDIPLVCTAEYGKQELLLDEIPLGVPLTFSKEDEDILFVLEDISEGPAKGHPVVNSDDFINLIRLHVGRKIRWEGHPSITVNEARLNSLLRMDLDGEDGQLILIVHTELPFMKGNRLPFHMVSGTSGWVYGAGNIWPLESILPAPYHAIYEEPIAVARPDVYRFMQKDLELLTKYVRLESDISPDLFSIEPAIPRFRLLARGSPASLSATLYAQYEDMELVAGKADAREHFAIPDPVDLMRYMVRNPEAERRALGIVSRTGFAGSAGDELASIVGNRAVLNFLGGQLPALRRRGWQIDLEGRARPYMESLDFAMPVVRVADGAGVDWFDISYDFEDIRGATLSHADIQLALRKGECFLKNGDSTILIDSDAIDSMTDVFSDCATEGGEERGHFRLAGIYAAFVKSSLDALDGIDVEYSPGWTLQAKQANRTIEIEPVSLGGPLDSILRPYQKEGVHWLRFLEKGGLCGLLADEMGLGKTLQALSWLQLPRNDGECRGQPALVVCPTSLVDNWAEEAARFVPDMKVLTLTGRERHDKWSSVPKAALVVTSYALLRRDLDRHLNYTFSAVILDEAQHIKNRATQNALAAKQVRGRHRLVLTGTPIENSVSDLWSIMDFLMPGYLGTHQTFRENYEIPIVRNEAMGEAAQLKLKRKLRPFLLRRLRKDVAKDLPPKIQKIAACPLTPDQQLVYAELLRSSRQHIAGIVTAKGFNKCRMEILTTLMRLRQVCCHLDLLKLPHLKPKHPSAKLDIFFELLDEALDSGHRVLVFSQFVSMLRILRRELEDRDLAYCYMDGATKNRMDVVRRFNTQREIPAFLISLKAGGTGLNLTGADMVVHFDPWWNPAVEDQATDRAYRIGQKRTVYSIKLITKGTIEEKVCALQKKKRAMTEATIESDEGMIQALTWDDIQELLSL